MTNNLERLTIESKNISSNSTTYRSPIMRVQKKNAMKKQSSVNNFRPNIFTHTIDLTNSNYDNYNNKTKTNKDYFRQKVDLSFDNLINNKHLNKSNSINYYNNYNLQDLNFPKSKSHIKRINNKKKLIKNKTLETPLNYSNFIKKIQNKNKGMLRQKTIPQACETKGNQDKLKIETDYYCINCYNQKMIPYNKEKIPFKNLNKSFDANYYHRTLQLKKIDEDYINKKVMKNHEKQLLAFNLLKNDKVRNQKSTIEKLQYINENEDNPFIGLNLQDYLYYKNKKKNENLNKTMINHINSYKYEKPRKAIRDYYKYVQYKIPLLEKKFGPSDKYKMKYIETLKKQMSDKEKEKKELKKLQIKTEMDENKQYKDYINKLEQDEREQKRLKQRIMYENNKYLEEFKKKRNGERKKEMIVGGENKLKKFNENQKDYKKFINQQRINEINSLQNWINENLKQKQKKINKKNKEEKKWDDYNKEFIRTYDDITYAEKCSNCNATYTIDKLYPFPKKNQFL